MPRDGAVATFLESALAEGKRYEAQVAQDLSSVVFTRVFPRLVERARGGLWRGTGRRCGRRR